MSDVSQGEGWWQASDLKWYAPEQHPDFRALPEPLPPEPAPPGPAAPALPAPEPQAPAPEPSRPATNNAKWVAVGILAVAVIAIGAFLFLGRGGDKKNTVVASSSSPSNSSTSSSSSSSASSQPTQAELQARLLTAKDFGAGFIDDTFGRNTDPTLPCGTPNPDLSIPPKIDIGIAAHAPAGISTQEEVVIYQNVSNEQTAFSAIVGGYDCPQGTITNSSSSQAIQFTKKSRAQELNVAEAVEIDFTASGFRGQLFFIRADVGVVGFSFSALDNVNAAALPDVLTIVKQGLAKLDG